MAFKKHILVLANVTASSDQLCHELSERAKREPARFRLIVPATSAGGGRTEAREKVKEAVARFREAGLEVEGSVGDPDPFLAVAEAWDPREYDEIIVSTLPMKFSKWLHAGLPQRLFKLTNCQVTHIVSEPPKPQVEPVPVEHEDHVLGPLEVLSWGKPHDDVQASAAESG